MREIKGKFKWCLVGLEIQTNWMMKPLRPLFISKKSKIKEIRKIRKILKNGTLMILMKIMTWNQICLTMNLSKIYLILELKNMQILFIEENWMITIRDQDMG